MTPLTASDGNKGARKVKFTSFKGRKGINFGMRLYRDGESEVERIEKCTEAVRKNGDKIGQFMHQRGHSFE